MGHSVQQTLRQKRRNWTGNYGRSDTDKKTVVYYTWSPSQPDTAMGLHLITNGAQPTVHSVKKRHTKDDRNSTMTGFSQRKPRFAGSISQSEMQNGRSGNGMSTDCNITATETKTKGSAALQMPVSLDPVLSYDCARGRAW